MLQIVNINTIKCSIWSFGLLLLICFVMAMCLVTETEAAESVQGQTAKSYILPSGFPTGSLADNAVLAGVDQSYYQPVQINVPDGVRVAVATAGDMAFLPQEKPLGYLLGRVYRLKLNEIPLHAESEIYPTLEIVNRLFPPQGREFDFPIVVDLTREDIELALGGNLVTRIVYLENPMGALPVDSTHQEGKLSFDVPDGYSPIVAAEQRGIIMAVIRMGSRLPNSPPNASDPFYFGLPPVSNR